MCKQASKIEFILISPPQQILESSLFLSAAQPILPTQSVKNLGFILESL